MSGTVYTHLTQVKISNLTEAVEIFSCRNSDGSQPIVLIPTRLPCSMYMNVPSGVYCVMQRFGKDLAGYDEGFPPGFHCLPPWYRVAFVVSRQSCTYTAPVKDCPTKDNVIVTVDITIVFSIVKPKPFVYQLGAMKFDQLLRAATEEAIRGLVRGTTHDEAYNLRGNKAQTFLRQLNERFDRFGVTFSDATITNVTLPTELAKTLENETTFESREREQKKSQQFKVKQITDKAELTLKELRAQNSRQAENERARKERILIEKEQKEIEAQKAKQLALIKAEENAAVLRYRAEAELQNSRLRGEKDAALLVLRAQGECEARKIKSEQEAATREVLSSASATAAENRAKALMIEGDAEARASEQLRDIRAHELEMERLRILKKLAETGRIVISGDNADRLISSFVSAGAGPSSSSVSVAGPSGSR